MATITDLQGQWPPTPAPTGLEVPPVPVRRFTVEEYDKLLEHGFFDDDDRFELLEGWIVPKMTRNPPHEVSLVLTRDAVMALSPAGWHVREQASVRTTDSVLEPDVSIVRGAPRDYRSHHPGPGDSALVVEVADSSLASDRKLKLRIYARAGVPVYWIINLVNRQVEVYTEPTGPGAAPSYGARRDYREGESVPLVLDGREVGRVSVADLLP